MSSEHVEVLDRLRGVLEHGKMGDKCLIAPDLVTAAIAALSAPQPPAEAQADPSFAEWLATEMPAGTVIGDPAWWANRIARQYAKRRSPAEAQAVAWEWEYIGVDQYPRGHKVARSLREMDPTNPPYPETWRPTRPLIYGDIAPPSAPVGVEQIIATDEAGWALAKRAEVAGAERDSDDNETWWTLRIEQFKVLAQQPAAVDGGVSYPTPRNRQEAAALAGLALAYLGVTRAHIDAVIARCETDLAAQPGGSE